MFSPYALLFVFYQFKDVDDVLDKNAGVEQVCVAYALACVNAV